MTPFAGSKRSITVAMVLTAVYPSSLFAGGRRALSGSAASITKVPRLPPRKRPFLSFFSFLMQYSVLMSSSTIPLTSSGGASSTAGTTRTLRALAATWVLFESSPASLVMRAKMPYRTLAISGAMSSRVPSLLDSSLSPREGGSWRCARLTVSLVTLCLQILSSNSLGTLKLNGYS